MKSSQTHIVPPDVNSSRLSDYAFKVFKHIASRKAVKKAIKAGNIKVNNELSGTGHWVQPGEKIEWLPSERPVKIYQTYIPVIYEDNNLAVINKPAGMVVKGNRFKTIKNALPANITPSTATDAMEHPEPVHRLDAPTSGLLLIAKTYSAMDALGKQFETGTIEKHYQAVVIGKLEIEGTIKSSIENKKAVTEYKPLQHFRSFNHEWLTLLELKPLTGRTHQLRIHMAEAGYPIAGDKLYGEPDQIIKNKGLLLCATGIGFIHPGTHEKSEYTLSIPHKFISLMKREAYRWHKYN